MQKKGPSRPNPVPAPAGHSLQRPAPPAMGGGVIRRAAVVPPRPMVTAQQRQERREQRRIAPATPARPALVINLPAGASQASSEALQAEVARFNDLQPKIMLTSANGDLEDIETAINAFPANLENIRTRGYVFKSYLEKKIETLTTQWRDLRPRVETAIRTQADTLQRDATQVQNTLNRGQSAATALSALESKAEAAGRTLSGMYDTLDTNVDQTQQQIDDVSWTLQQVEQASYGFTPTEAPVEAVPANWKKPGDPDGVEGVLLLTDQRLLFEQKEEVATKKVLFVTTAKEKLQSLQWQVPVAQIAQAVGSKKGFMSKDDYLTITCANEAALLKADNSPMYVEGVGGAVRTAEIHLRGETGEAWQGFIGRVKSGDIDKERTVPVDAAAAAAVANAPTKCTTCGATLAETILRGQTEITCPYCGSKMRLG